MNDKYIQGKITFIHHEKNRAVIEYSENGRKKTIQANLEINEPEKTLNKKTSKKLHRFLVGDIVTFLIKKTGSNGRILSAHNISYQYNTALEILVNKAIAENKFLGYIKFTDDEYFIKEIESYLFFPLRISRIEVPPAEQEMINPVTFKLNNILNPDKLFATLYNHNYIPEFQTAIQLFKRQTIIKALIHKISAYGIYLHLVNDKIDAKLPIDEFLADQIAGGKIQAGQTIDVKIKYLSPEKVIVEKANDVLQT